MKRRIPCVWSRQWLSIVAECDIRPTRHGRLYAKLLIFKNPRTLQVFWRDGLKNGSLGRWTVGAVNALVHWTETVGATGEVIRKQRDVDPRYFCVIGLCETKLSMEVISHEAVHAGFCYAKRVKRTPWDAARKFDEEEVAYPSGAIAKKINAFLYARKLYR